MKKTVIIVISIGFIILLSLIFGARFLENKKAELNIAKEQAMAKSADAATKAKILELSLMLINWSDKNNGSYANFVESQPNNDEVKKLINKLEQEKNIKLDYSIASTKNNFVIRIKSSTYDKFYCIDSSTPGISEPTSSTETIFRSKTNCKGESL